MKYPKINTLFKRDDNGHIIPEEFTEEEFIYLSNNLWECTEKIDGTNIRISLCPTNEEGDYSVKYKGRTDNAQIPLELAYKLKDLFPVERIVQVFEKTNVPITLYGEGYGRKIQKGGNYIPDGVNFILFDIRVGNIWLRRDTCEEIAKELKVDIVPIIGHFTLFEAIEYVKKGFKSTIAHNKDYDAEGLVLKPTVGLLNRRGERIITKLKTKDFRQINQ